MTRKPTQATAIGILLGVLAVLVVATAWLLHVGPFERSDGGEVIATVNGRPIHLDDARFRVAGLTVMHGDLTAAGGDWVDQVFQSLVDDRLIEAEAERLGLEMTDQELAAEIRRLQGMFSTPGEYEEWLRSQGINQDELERRVRLQAIAVKVFEAVTADVEVSSEEARAYFEEHRADFTDAEGNPQSFADARPTVEQALESQRRSEAFAVWQDERRETADVVVVDPDWWRSIQDEQSS